MRESVRIAAGMAAVVTVLLLTLILAASTVDSVRTSVIVQAGDLAAAAEAVRAVGGGITKELGIIRAVAADLTPGQVDTLARRGEGLRIYGDRRTSVAGGGHGGGGNGGGGSVKETYFPTLIDADLLHAQGVTGRGVRVAFIDTYIDQRLGRAGVGRENHSVDSFEERERASE